MNGETIEAFQARAEQRLAEHDARLTAPLLATLRRARRSVTVLRLVLADERTRARAAVAELEALCESASASGPGREWYTANVALLRVKAGAGDAVKRYADADQDPSRTLIGTILRTTFPKTRQNGGEHRARTTLPMELHEAIRFFDPFQAHSRVPERFTNTEED